MKQLILTCKKVFEDNAFLRSTGSAYFSILLRLCWNTPDPWGVTSKIDVSSVGFVIVSILLAGVIGKVAGCGLAARLRGASIRESIAVGVGMMPRAGVDLVIAVVGLTLGVLTMELYLSTLVLIYTTSLTAPVLLKKFLTYTCFLQKAS